jgi:heptosyltransferase-2
MNPGAAYGSAKRWLPDRFAEVANWFMKDTNGSVVIFGGRDESGIAQEIEKSAWIQEPERRELTAHSLLNLAGNTSLRDLISLISECNLFLGNDSGPMHIAYAVGTPLVALFGSTEPNLTGPLGEGNAVIKHVLPCSPCFERTCKADDLRCMDEITSDEVYLSLKKIMPDKPAVFFDRDGTLCEDMNYLKSRDDFRLLPGVGNLARLKAAGLMLIGVTNQSGVARGLVGEGFVREINNLFIKEFGFDGFFYCPHHPEEHCPCRKPEPGMINDARHTYGIDPRKSYVVGDKEADMLLARAVGARGILIRTGQQKDSPHADFVAEGLREAVDLIMKNERI